MHLEHPRQRCQSETGRSPGSSCQMAFTGQLDLAAQTPLLHFPGSHLSASIAAYATTITFFRPPGLSQLILQLLELH